VQKQYKKNKRIRPLKPLACPYSTTSIIHHHHQHTTQNQLHHSISTKSFTFKPVLLPMCLRQDKLQHAENQPAGHSGFNAHLPTAHHSAK
jgi:hypothetical protein